MASQINSEELAVALLEMFPSLPNPEHQPIAFQYYVNMFMYYKKMEK